MQHNKTIGGIQMFKKFKKQINNEKGLTLIELLAVIVILAIVAAIAIPSIGNIIGKSKERAILADASMVLSGAKIAVSNGECTEVTGGGFTCDQDTLKSYVEGITFTGTNKVSKDGTDEWKIQYGGFPAETSGWKYLKPTPALTSGTAATEKALLEAMGNKAPVATGG